MTMWRRSPQRGGFTRGTTQMGAEVRPSMTMGWRVRVYHNHGVVARRDHFADAFSGRAWANDQLLRLERDLAKEE